MAKLITCKDRWVLKGLQDQQKWNSKMMLLPLLDKDFERHASKHQIKNWDLFHVDLNAAFSSDENLMLLPEK